MTYSLWHCGVLMGQADLQKNPQVPRQLVGVFRPTAYGRRLLPRLTGLLAAAAELKAEMTKRGLSEESLPEGAAEELIESTPAGQSLVDVGRVLSEVELRNAAGVTLTFQSIGFTDLGQLRSMARKLGCAKAAADLEYSPLEPSQVLVSATLAPRQHTFIRASRVEVT